MAGTGAGRGCREEYRFIRECCCVSQGTGQGWTARQVGGSCRSLPPLRGAWKEETANSNSDTDARLKEDRIDCYEEADNAFDQRAVLQCGSYSLHVSLYGMLLLLV